MRTEIWKWVGICALLWPAVLVAALLCAQIVPCWYISADSAVYVELARNLSSGRGYVFNGEAFFGYPPVFPGLLAAGMYVFGQSAVVMRALAVVLAAGFLGASFFVIKRFTGWRVALLAVWLFGLSTELAGWVTFVMSDFAGAVFSMLALLAIVHAERTDRRRCQFGWASALALALMMLAVFTRLANLALVGAVVLCYFALSRDRFSRGTLRTMTPLVGVVLGCVVVWLVMRFTSGVTFHRMPYLALLESHKDWDTGYLGPLELINRTFLSIPVWLGHLSSVFVANTATVSAWVRWLAVLLFLLGLGVAFVRRHGLVECFTLVVLILPMATPFTGSGARYYLVIGPLAFMYICEALAWLTGLVRRLSPSRREVVRFVTAGLLVLPVVLMAVGLGPLGDARGWFRSPVRVVAAVAFAASMLVGLIETGPWSFRRLLVPVSGALLLVVWTTIQLGIVVPKVADLRKAQRGHDVYYRHAELARIAERLCDLAQPGDACLSSEPRLYRALTGLRSYRFPLTRDKDRVMAAFRLGRWVVVDLRRPEDPKFAVPVLESHSDLFELVAENERAQLWHRTGELPEVDPIVAPVE